MSKRKRPPDKKNAPGAATPGGVKKQVKLSITEIVSQSMISCQEIVVKTLDIPRAQSPPVEQKNTPRQGRALGRYGDNKTPFPGFYCTIIPPLCPHLANLMTQARARIARAERAGNYGRAWLHWLILRQLEQLNSREGWYRT